MRHRSQVPSLKLVSRRIVGAWTQDAGAVPNLTPVRQVDETRRGRRALIALADPVVHMQLASERQVVVLVGECAREVFEVVAARAGLRLGGGASRRARARTSP